MSIRKEVEHKLSSSILRRLVGREAISSYPKRVCYRVYQYVHDGLLLIAGVGISHPIIKILTGEADNQAQTVATGNNIDELFGWLLKYPLPVALFCVALIVLWFGLRVYVSVEKLADRVPLYDACSTELGKIEANLNDALASATPLKELTTIHNDVSQTVGRYFDLHGWPWPVGPQNRKMKERINSRVKELCDQFEQGWVALPVVEQEE